MALPPMLCACALVLGACNSHAPESPPAAPVASPYQPTATFQEVMDSVVDPSGDFIWNSVSTVMDVKGVHENQPRTDKEWHEVRRRAILLAESANLLAVPGRRVARGEKTAEAGDALDVKAIQRRLDRQHAQLVGFASALRDISLQLVAATDRKDVAAITDLGGTLDEVCESCHKVFWYPDQK
jgi:cytochrome c556